MSIAGKKVAVLVDNYFEQSEFEEPIDALREAGVEVQVVAAKAKALQGLNHIEKGETFTADLLIREAIPEDYDALILPGGAINADGLRMVEAAQSWVRSFLEDDKPVAAICHAPWLLVSADLVDGRRLTSYETIQDDIQNAGGDWLNEPVVIDESLITSRKPDDIPAFNEALIRVLRDGLPTETADAIQSGRKGSADAALNEYAYDKQRDGIDRAAEKDILEDEDDADPDEMHLSSVTASDERDSDQ